MSQPQCHHLLVGPPAARHAESRRMAYWDWPVLPGGDPHRVVICVHGLSRQARDFDTLAQALQPQSRVLAVDVAGRGASDWLADPMAYHVGTYAADLAALIHHIRSQDPDVRIDWVGTSMGGLIGMALAAQPALGLRRLVLNDVGPAIRWQALQRIGSYLGLDPLFATEQAAVDYLAGISSGFGPHTPEQWRALSLPMLRQRPGGWGLHYDPAIAQPFKTLLGAADPGAAEQAAHAGEAALWALYDAISARTLLLRGADSDLLSRDTAAEMGRRGPRAACIEFANVGHAPSLMAHDQTAAVQAFLAAP
jgi:pimeloyl-ACP methyl ester carboxylesterase